MNRRAIRPSIELAATVLLLSALKSQAREARHPGFCWFLGARSLRMGLRNPAFAVAVILLGSGIRVFTVALDMG